MPRDRIGQVLPPRGDAATGRTNAGQVESRRHDRVARLISPRCLNGTCRLRESRSYNVAAINHDRRMHRSPSRRRTRWFPPPLTRQPSSWPRAQRHPSSRRRQPHGIKSRPNCVFRMRTRGEVGRSDLKFRGPRVPR